MIQSSMSRIQKIKRRFLDSSFAKNFLASDKLPYFLSILAALVYLIQAIDLAHHLGITMDEGTYLMKGLLYLRGDYRPFEAYGPRTNKMPLAFLIPGAVQCIFGPGLRSGRYFMIIVGLLTLLPIWITSKRLVGLRWATVAVWLVALNPALIGFSSQAISQGITASLIAWVFVFSLGKDRSLVSLLVGSALAAVTMLVRQNLLPLVPFLILYILWLHGWRYGLYATLLAGFILIAAHAIYWPDIMSIWTPYLPDFINNSLFEAFIEPESTEHLWNPSMSFSSRLLAFFEGIRYNFSAVIIPMVAGMLIVPRKNWKDISLYKTMVFLGVLGFVLLGMHAWASIGQNYCTFCFSPYIVFFYPIGILLGIIMLQNCQLKPSRFRSFLISLFVIIISAGVRFGVYQEFDDDLLYLRVPQISTGRIIKGPTYIWEFLADKLGKDYSWLRLNFPIAVGFFIALFLVLFIIVIFFLLRRKNPVINGGYAIAMVFIALGVLLSPSIVLGGEKIRVDYCVSDVIASHEAVGNYLAEVIPPGSLVYWENDISPLPLLYIPEVKVFPPQLNQKFNFIEGGDSDILARKGYWNTELADQWIRQADFVLLDEVFVSEHPELKDGSIQTQELPPTMHVVDCRAGSRIHVFRNVH